MRRRLPHSEPAGNPTDLNKPGTLAKRVPRVFDEDHILAAWRVASAATPPALAALGQ